VTQAAPSRWLLASAALLVVLCLAFLWLADAGERSALGVPAPGPAGAAPRPAPPEAAELFPPRRIEVSAAALARTTVLWPLRLELELLEARYLPTEPGVPRVGAGATARISGRVFGANERGARAEVCFVAGTNEGRVLHTDSAGSFGATDLYPGLAIVEVSGPGLLGSRRQVRLRQEQETLLNLSYGRPGSVTGRVIDESGAGIDGAEIRIDGQRVRSAPDGSFALSSVAGGQVLVEVTHSDFASYQELVSIAGGHETSGERVTFKLERGSTLRVAISGNVGGPGPVELYLLSGQPLQRSRPDSFQRAVSFPFWALNPIEVEPGGTRAIRGLPRAPVHVYAFRPGAKPVERVVNLRTDQELTLPLEATSVLTGHVSRAGVPVARARVSLEAPNQVRATLDFFRQASHFLEAEVLPRLPAALQRVESDERGRFVLTAFDNLTGTRYLEARGPDGASWAGRLVHAGEEKVDLELEDVTLGDSTLHVDLSGRWQGLPMEVLVGGAPLDPTILPPDEPLDVKNLVSGRWRARSTWHGDLVHETELVIDGEATLSFPLPLECVEGQDEEAWKRAGREYPGSGTAQAPMPTR
jgi:hypothetical protein